ncbi:hypothetical protein HanIR_Chr05g0227041 [Helianthus annuus]|nr:hypothetical protein HanIR_Chr05g0227041 [Helianthus annuus]
MVENSMAAMKIPVVKLDYDKTKTQNLAYINCTSPLIHKINLPQNTKCPLPCTSTFNQVNLKNKLNINHRTGTHDNMSKKTLPRVVCWKAIPVILILRARTDGTKKNKTAPRTKNEDEQMKIMVLVG